MLLRRHLLFFLDHRQHCGLNRLPVLKPSRRPASAAFLSLLATPALQANLRLVQLSASPPTPPRACKSRRLDPVPSYFSQIRFHSISSLFHFFPVSERGLP